LVYAVRVRYDSSDRFVLDGKSNEIEISVCSAPVKGKANGEMVKKLQTQGKKR
jgi:uncharacterized protein YggU (UPF0235/DUF167 family)